MPFIPLVILSYFFAGPPIAGVLLFTALSLGQLSMGDWLSALPPVAGFSYILGALPAIITSIVAAYTSRSATWIGRATPPIAVAVLTAVVMVWAVLLRGAGWDVRLLALTGIAAAVTAALIGGLLEVARKPVA